MEMMFLANYVRPPATDSTSSILTGTSFEQFLNEGKKGTNGKNARLHGEKGLLAQRSMHLPRKIVYAF